LIWATSHGVVTAEDIIAAAERQIAEGVWSYATLADTT